MVWPHLEVKKFMRKEKTSLTEGAVNLKQRNLCAITISLSVYKHHGKIPNGFVTFHNAQTNEH
jgi:hypothetical protein